MAYIGTCIVRFVTNIPPEKRLANTAEVLPRLKAAARVQTRIRRARSNRLKLQEKMASGWQSGIPYMRAKILADRLRA